MQASTNIIHTKISSRIPRNISNIKLSTLNGKSESQEEPIKKVKGQKVKQAEAKLTATSTTKIDENDEYAFVKNAYNPLDAVYPFDEELYEKVLKLELADDGLPAINCDEPFDF